jgi:hypothetical protein
MLLKDIKSACTHQITGKNCEIWYVGNIGVFYTMEQKDTLHGRQPDLVCAFWA